jgi:hypothetical protein
VVAAAVSTALGALYSNRWDMPKNAVVEPSLRCWPPEARCLPRRQRLANGVKSLRSKSHWSSVIAFMYLASFGSVIAYTAFVWLLDNAPVSLVATYAYGNPVIAMVLGVLLMDEHVKALMGAGALAIVASVVAVVRTEGSA